MMTWEETKFALPNDLSPAFERRLGDFLRFVFPPLPGGEPDLTSGFFADMQLMDDLKAELGCPVTFLGDSALPVAAHLMPTAVQLHGICAQVLREAWWHHDFIAVGAEARAHVLAGRLRETGLSCKKLFVHAQLGATQGPAAQPATSYRGAVLVFVKQDSGEAQAQVIDLSLFPRGAVRPSEYIRRIVRAGPVTVEITAASQLRPPSVHGYDLREYSESIAEASAFLRQL